MKKIWYGLFIGLFFLICLIPLVGMLILGPAAPAANEVPAAKPRLLGLDGEVNLNFLTELQTYVANGFALRLEGITAWDTLVDKVFHTSGNDDVLIGPDGWLFYGGAVNDIAGADQMTDREIWCAARSLALMQEYAESQGARFFITVPCGKYTLYPAHAPSYVTVAEGSNRTRLAEEMERQGVNYVNLYDAFSAVDEELYWHWDSHWHSRGAALAADQLMMALGEETDYFSGPFETVTDHVGDLYEMLYPTGSARETDYIWQPGFTFSYLSRFHSADDITIETENPGAAGSLLMFRDSSGRSLYPYMAQSFGRAYFSRANNYRLDLIDQQQATAVIVEIAERTLPYLIQYPAVYPAPTRDDAVLVGATAVDSDLAAEEADKTMVGYYKLTGTLPETAVDAAVYVQTGDTIYEAIPGEGSFTLWLPAGADWESARVYTG